MGKIIRLSDKMDHFLSTQEFMEDTMRVFAQEGVECVLIAGKNAEGEVLTGYYKCDFGARQELVGHVQCDIIDQMLRANPERYGGE